MSKSTKIDELTNRDLQILNEVLIGCSKLILSLDNTKANLLSVSKISQKDIAKNSIITDSLDSPEGKSVRPFEFRDRLPTSVKNIHSSTMSEILGDLKQANILEEPPTKISSKSGRIPKSDTRKRSGVKSYYQKSKFVDELTNVINKKEARQSLFKSLSESGLLGRYLFHNHLLAIYQEKQNSQDKLDEIDLANLKKTTKSDGDDIFKQIRKVTDHSKLRKIASMMTNVLMEEVDENSPLLLRLYVIGRTCYLDPK